MDITVVVGNPRPESRTTVAARAVADRIALAHDQPGSIDVIELSELTDGLFDWESSRCQAAVDQVLAADAAVIASPTYKATYTGLLKVFLDRFGHGELGGLPTAAVMLGGSPAHSLAVEVHLRPLLAEIGAATWPGLYVLESELEQLTSHVDRWWSQCSRLAAAGAGNR